MRLESRALRSCGRELEQLVEFQERCLLLLELLAQSRWENSASAQAILQQYAISLQARTLGSDSPRLPVSVLARRVVFLNQLRKPGCSLSSRCWIVSVSNRVSR